MHPKKRWGQHFLVHQPTQDKILAAAELSPEDTVLEVGTGLGLLTAEIARRVARVITVEIDKKLMAAATAEFGNAANIEFIRGDVLKLNLAELLKGVPSYKAIANLPYYITTPIIERLITLRPKPLRIVIMVQREVARRILAAPGTKDYGAFSIFVQYHTEPRRIAEVGRGAFYPPPEVNSTLLTFVPRKNPLFPGLDENLFFKLTRAAFGKRRKTLRNALLMDRKLKLNENHLERALAEAGIDGGRRGETLFVDEYARLCYNLARLR